MTLMDALPSTSSANTQEPCPICGEGHVTLCMDPMPFAYKGVEGSVDLHFKTCDVCQSDYAGAVEMRLNKRCVEAFKDRVDAGLAMQAG